MRADHSPDEPITSINITPLVDVSLVLVIVFMITMPFLVEKSMKIKPSETKVVQVSPASEPILVEVSGKGVSVEGRSVKLDELAGTLKKIRVERNVSAVSISAGENVLHGEVIKVLDEVMVSGTQEVNLLDPE